MKAHKILVLSAVTFLSACSEKEPSRSGPQVVDFEVTPEAFRQAGKVYEKTLEENRSILNADLRKALAFLDGKSYLDAMSTAQVAAKNSADVRVKGLANLIVARALSLDGKSGLAGVKYRRAFGILGMRVEPKTILLLSHVADRDGIVSGRDGRGE